MRPEEPACAPPWDGVAAPCPRWAAPAAPPRHRESIRSLHRTRGLVSVPFRVCPRASRARSSAAGARAGGSGLWAHGPPALPQFSDRLLCGRLSRVNTATPACFLPSRLPFSPASNSFWNCLVCREIAETEQEPPWPPTHTRHLSPHCRCLTGPVHWPSLCVAGSPVPSRGARQGRACPRGQRATGLGERPLGHVLPFQRGLQWPWLFALQAASEPCYRSLPRGPGQAPPALGLCLATGRTGEGLPQSPPRPGPAAARPPPSPRRSGDFARAALSASVSSATHPWVVFLRGHPTPSPRVRSAAPCRPVPGGSHAGAELRLAWGSPLPGQGRAGSVSHGLALLAG